MLADIAAVLAPVFVCAGIGYGWARSGIAFEREFITRLVTNIGTPCLVLSTLSRLTVSADAFLSIAGMALLCIASISVVGVLGLRLLRLPVRDFLPPVVFGNSGNVGMPLCLFAFGEAGLSLGIGYFVVASIFMFVFAPAIAAGRISWRLLLRSPIYYAIAFGIAVMLTGWTLPVWATNTLGLLGGLTIPLMLITLGISLAALRVESLWRSLSVALLRLGGGFATGWALAEAFDLEGPMRGVVIVQSAMPTAVFVYLFAARYDRAAGEVAGVVLLSTAIGFACLPLLLMLVM